MTRSAGINVAGLLTAQTSSLATSLKAFRIGTPNGIGLRRCDGRVSCKR